MEFSNHFSRTASLLGERARALMLWQLLDGRAYTATELSLCADISFQSASNHLAKLLAAGVLLVEKQGRHRYFRFASPEVAQVIESMASLVELPAEWKKREAKSPSGITYARSCYDHLAGRAGVEITAALLRNDLLREEGPSYAITDCGQQWFRALNIEEADIRCRKRSFARPCLDWSERKHHLAGALGAALLQVMVKEDWIRRLGSGRQLGITPKGKMELKERLGLIL